MKGEHVANEQQAPPMDMCRGFELGGECHVDALVELAQLSTWRRPELGVRQACPRVDARENHQRSVLLHVRLLYNTCYLYVARRGADGRVEVDERIQEDTQLMLAASKS